MELYLVPHPRSATLGRCYTSSQTLYLGILSRLLLSRNVFGGQSWFCIWSFRTVSLRKFAKQNFPMHQNYLSIVSLF